MLKLAALESNKNQDLEKKEGRIDDLLRVSSKLWMGVGWGRGWLAIVKLLRKYLALSKKFYSSGLGEAFSGCISTWLKMSTLKWKLFYSFFKMWIEKQLKK